MVHSGSNPPGNWFAPPGSNRSSSGGNETAEASGAEGRNGDSASMQAVTRVNAEQASKRLTQELTRPDFGEGRSWWNRMSEQVSISPAGVLATACRQRGPYATREVPAVIAVRSTGNSRETGRADWDDGEARSTGEAG